MASELSDPATYATDNQVGLYQPGMVVDNEYTLVPGVCVLPLAEDPPESPQELALWSPVVVLRLHSPYRIRRARFNVKKSTTPPVLPAPGDVGAFVFTGGVLSLGWPSINNTLVSSDWAAQAEYVYVENCVSRTVDGYVLGIPGYVTNTQAENAATLGGVGTPTYGAIAQAGTDAKVGWTIAQSIVPGQLWSYNCQSYWPGIFFNDQLPNGGQGSFTGVQGVA